MPYNSETETFYQAPATVVDSTPDGDTVQEGFDDRLTPAMAGLYADLNLLKADGMISVGIPATTTSRGIARVATLADMEPGAEVGNGPAFPDVQGGVITPTPTPYAVPQADAEGTIDAWVTPYVPQPSMSGTATFIAATNTITMAGIVPALGLEVGDVLKFGGGADTNNAKLRTVEAITNNNTIVVNYEHCGNRGNGSLKLSDQIGVSVTCTRIAKWYNASIGLGQEWVNVYSLRSVAPKAAYTGPQNRQIAVSIFASRDPSAELQINGVTVAKTHAVDNSWYNLQGAVPSSSSYLLQSSGTPVLLNLWSELR